MIDRNGRDCFEQLSAFKSIVLFCRNHHTCRDLGDLQEIWESEKVPLQLPYTLQDAMAILGFHLNPTTENFFLAIWYTYFGKVDVPAWSTFAIRRAGESNRAGFPGFAKNDFASFCSKLFRFYGVQAKVWMYFCLA